MVFNLIGLYSYSKDPFQNIINKYKIETCRIFLKNYLFEINISHHNRCL